MAVCLFAVRITSDDTTRLRSKGTAGGKQHTLTKNAAQFHQGGSHRNVRSQLFDVRRTFQWRLRQRVERILGATTMLDSLTSCSPCDCHTELLKEIASRHEVGLCPELDDGSSLRRMAHRKKSLNGLCHSSLHAPNSLSAQPLDGFLRVTSLLHESLPALSNRRACPLTELLHVRCRHLPLSAEGAHDRSRKRAGDHIRSSVAGSSRTWQGDESEPP
mmetsp:Transcript_37398/g.99400  ORF Transcript_37398/g.99400 Transcript_37398/m.99400 type:complete len:217 (-) Transcript_37398:61-711(-)